jgi:hypothetical protein
MPLFKICMCVCEKRECRRMCVYMFSENDAIMNLTLALTR